jgi:hypothetical protein
VGAAPVTSDAATSGSEKPSIAALGSWAPHP